MNNKKAVSGVITAIIMVAIALAVVGLAYVFFTGALTGANQSVQTQKGVLDDILPDGDTDDEGGTDTLDCEDYDEGLGGTCVASVAACIGMGGDEAESTEGCEGATPICCEI
jgi:flagellin-like protein